MSNCVLLFTDCQTIAAAFGCVVHTAYSFMGDRSNLYMWVIYRVLCQDAHNFCRRDVRPCASPHQLISERTADAPSRRHMRACGLEHMVYGWVNPKNVWVPFTSSLFIVNLFSALSFGSIRSYFALNPTGRWRVETSLLCDRIHKSMPGISLSFT